jgi:glycosyltransferase involved in cell wall biosynthesis
MDISVVIATHNQKERLRLVLAGLQAQTLPVSRFEVIVVDDGCTDGTTQMLAQVRLPLKVVSLVPNQGRCLARNRGVREAQGQVVAFLDGDALPHPEWLQKHWEVFEEYGPDCLLCGMEYSLPDLEYLQDPQTGAVMEGLTPSVVREHLRLHREETTLTEEMVRQDFADIHARAQEGGYPFPELKTLQDQTLELFATYPDSPIGWIGFYPHNGMVSREAFERVGGFDKEIPFSEGWDLAYRLQQAGIRPYFVPEARTYHLYHHHGFSNPAKAVGEMQVRRRAVRYMAEGNGNPRLWLTLCWQAGIWPDPFLPEEMVLPDLIAFHHQYQEITPETLEEVQTILQRHPLYGSRLLEEPVSLSVV